MDQIELNAQPRSVTGKKVKALRAQGLMPLVVYGRSLEPMNIQSVEFDTRRAFSRASGQLIALNIEGEEAPRMVLVRDIQRDVLTGTFLHADLYEVDVTEKVQVEVSLNMVGEPELVSNGEAVLMTVLNSVEIECLPTDIMQSIEVDVNELVDMDDAIYVRDLIISNDVELLTPLEEMVVRLQPVFEEEEEEEEEEEYEVEVGEVEVIQRGKIEEEEGEEE